MKKRIWSYIKTVYTDGTSKWGSEKKQDYVVIFEDGEEKNVPWDEYLEIYETQTQMESDAYWFDVERGL